MEGFSESGGGDDMIYLEVVTADFILCSGTINSRLMPFFTEGRKPSYCVDS